MLDWGSLNAILCSFLLQIFYQWVKQTEELPIIALTFVNIEKLCKFSHRIWWNLAPLSLSSSDGKSRRPNRELFLSCQRIGAPPPSPRPLANGNHLGHVIATKWSPTFRQLVSFEAPFDTTSENKAFENICLMVREKLFPSQAVQHHLREGRWTEALRIKFESICRKLLRIFSSLFFFSGWSFEFSFHCWLTSWL